MDYATSGGDAVAGTDYLPASGTLSFAAGETSKLIVLQLPAGPGTPGAAKTFNLTLSNPTGGATLGTRPPRRWSPSRPWPSPPASERGKYFAAGAGVGGGPRVTVYDSATGATRWPPSSPTSRRSPAGVTVAAADLTGDGIDDIAVGSGFGGGPRIRVFDGAATGGRGQPDHSCTTSSPTRTPSAAG